MARTMLVFASALGVAIVSTGIARAELSIGNGEYIIIDSVHVGYPALSFTTECNGERITGLPGGLPVSVMATFVNADGSGPNAPYGGLESWSGGMVGTDDDHYGTDLGSSPRQVFHVVAYPADGWTGPGAYSFDAFAQDGSLKTAYTEVERTFKVLGYPPSGGGEPVKCPFAHPFDVNNLLLDAAKAGAKAVVGEACGCSSVVEGADHALDLSDLFLGRLKSDVVDDPPDDNYQQIATPQPAPVLDPPPGLTTDQQSTLLSLESALATDLGLERALMTSENRSWGALNGGDRAAYLAQTKAIGDYADQIATNIGALDQLYANLQAAYAPSIPAFSITHQDVAKYQNDSFEGLPPDEAAVLSQLGASTDDEAQIIDSIDSIDADKVAAADGVSALFQQDDDALVAPLEGMAAWARNVATTPPPVVADVSPRTLTPGGGNQVTITGSNLSDVTAITFGASTPTSGLGTGISCSETQCTTTAPPGHGTVDVVAVGAGGPSVTGPQDRVSYVAPAKPTVTHVSPASGVISGNTQVTVTGTGLSNGTVFFGATPGVGTQCTDTRCTSYTQTAAAPGVVDVQVQTDGGLSDTSAADQFTYLGSAPPPPGAPVVTSVAPSSGSNLGGETVTIHGSNFTRATAVDFGPSTSALQYDVVDDTTITAEVPPDYQAETVDVQVYGPGGTSALVAADQFSYVLAPPTITSVSPTSGPDTGGTAFTITGTNLGSGSTSIEIGSGYVADTVCSESKCTGTIPAGTDGPADVTVWTDNGQATQTNGFTYVAGPLPVIDNVAPDTGDVAGGTSVVISGSNLTGGQVMFGSANAPGIPYPACTEHTCVVTAPAADKGGIVDVHVSTNAGTSATTPADTFSYVHLAAPVVTSVTPDHGYLAGYDDVHIAGSNLEGGHVFFAGVEAYGASCTMTACDAKAPVGTSAGPVVISVTTSSGPSSTTPSAANEYTYTRPAVTGISPNNGWTEGGTTVTITGTDLPGTADNPDASAQVKFGTTWAPSATCYGTSCTATTPSVTAGTAAVDVTVEGGIGTWSPATSADTFTYFPRPVPTVTSLSPSSGTDGGGDQVIVTGTDLDAGTVSFGTKAATATCTHTTCAATSPRAAADGAVDVTVHTSAGTSATNSGDRFTYGAPAAPTISNINPSSGSVVGGKSVTITGTSLTGGTITFGGKGATGVTCTATQCTATTPSATSAGSVPVVVTTHPLVGSPTASTSYSYVLPPAPVVSKVDPAGGPASGGTPFSVGGTDLDGGSVTIGGTAASGVSCHPTYCVGMTPAGTAGVTDIVVTTPGGASAAVAADKFTYSPVTITEHNIPNAAATTPGTPLATGTGAGGVVRGANGDMWFTMPNVDQIGRVSHTDGTITSYKAVPRASGTGGAAPTGIALGPDNRIYYAERNTDVIVAIDDSGVQQSYSVPGSAGDPGGSVGDMRFVTAGPDGRMWFTLGYSGAIGALNTSTGAVQEWHLPDPYVLPYNIVSGPDGRLWFTEVSGSALGAITTSGKITEYPLPTPGSWGWGLTVGADNRLWIGEAMARDVAAVTTDGVATTYTVPDELDDPQGVIAGADGRMWFTAPDHDTINALDPVSGAVTEYAMPPGYPVGEAPRYLAMDTTGTLWVTENLGAHILSVSGITSSAVPTVTSVTPDHGAAGTAVTLSGSNFQGTTGVSFGGVAATSFTVVDPVHITAVAPAGSGVVHITVTTPHGTSATTSSDRYSYGSASPAGPEVLGVSPGTGPLAGGTTVTITGRHLSGGAIAFGGNAATGVTCSTDSSCTAVSPAGSAGPVDVVVTTAAGASAAGDVDRFVYLTPMPDAPTVTSVSPASGSDTGGTAVTVSGTGLSGGTIAFGVEVASDASCTSTSCTVTTPPGGAGPVDVRVTTAGGTSPRTSADAFTYVAATKAAVSVALTPSTTSYEYTNGSVEFDATLSRAIPGDLQIYVDNNAVGQPVHNESGSNYISTVYFAGPTDTSYFGVGNHTVRAVFTPIDSDYYANGVGTTSFSVTKASTQTTLHTLATSPNAAQPINLYALVSPAQASGSVQFLDGSTSLGAPVPVSGGSAYDYVPLTAGTHQLHAVFTPTDSADWSGSTGDLSLNVAAGGVADKTSASVAAPASASYGSKVTVSTTLTDTTTSARIGSASLTLMSRPSSTASWKAVGSATTSSTGAAHITFVAKANQQLRWVYAGNASHSGATSATKTLSVHQTVALSCTTTKIAHGRTFKLYGWVNPPSAGKTVVLQQKVGTKWINVATAVLKKQRLPNGSTRVGYVFSRSVSKASKVTFRVRRAATSTLAVGLSVAKTITIT